MDWRESWGSLSLRAGWDGGNNQLPRPHLPARLSFRAEPRSAEARNRRTLSFRAEAAGRRRGIALVPTEGLSLYREDGDSSPPPALRAGSARNDKIAVPRR